MNVETTQSTAVPETKLPADAGLETNSTQTPETTPPPEDKFAGKFAALSKKEREIKRIQQEMRQREQLLAEKEAKLKEFEEKKKRARENPLDYLAEGELTYDDLTQYYLNGKKPSPETKVGVLETKLQELEKKLQDKLKEEEESKKMTRVKEFQGEISKHIQEKNEKYELLNTFGSAETVYNLIDQHYQETGSIMDIEEACDLAESYFEKEAEAQAEKMRKLKKLANKFGSFNEESPKADVRPTPNETRPTLTNELSQNLPTRSDRPMTDRDRLKKAAEMLKFL